MTWVAHRECDMLFTTDPLALNLKLRNTFKSLQNYQYGFVCVGLFNSGLETCQPPFHLPSARTVSSNFVAYMPPKQILGKYVILHTFLN